MTVASQVALLIASGKALFQVRTPVRFSGMKKAVLKI